MTVDIVGLEAEAAALTPSELDVLKELEAGIWKVESRARQDSASETKAVVLDEVLTALFVKVAEHLVRIAMDRNKATPERERSRSINRVITEQVAQMESVPVEQVTQQFLDDLATRARQRQADGMAKAGLKAFAPSKLPRPNI